MQPFEATLRQLSQDADHFIDAVFADLGSEFLTMPRGDGFVDYELFAEAYEHLKLVTQSFSVLDAEKAMPELCKLPLSLLVVRSVLGFTPSEWAYITSERTGEAISQGFARTLDRDIRLAPKIPMRATLLQAHRMRTMLGVAFELIREGAPKPAKGLVHRLHKADTATGISGVAHLAAMGAPYAMLLYERFLGRPFAGHRDSVSELVGDVLESAIEVTLTERKISFRKTKRAERLPGFDQAPDFIIPDEFNPRVVIEAKITEDDGTARDKVTRVQHLAAISRRKGFQLVACIGGRGFKVRREDMKKLLIATQGKVFTARTLDRLVDHTMLQKFRS